jgi:site-specific DNA recombinase
MREKAAQGIYPSRPPLGYRNNKLLRTIEVDPDNAPIAQRMFELYATGSYSLATLRLFLKAEYGKVLSKWHIEKLLRNPFYIGTYEWEGKSYAGTHPPLVSPEMLSRVREVLSGKARPRKQIHEFAFSGLLRCAYDNCAVTAEFKKQKYTYYRCTGYRGKCDLPYFREEVMAERLGQILQAIRIPDGVLAQLEESLLSDKTHEETLRKRQAERIERRLALLPQGSGQNRPCRVTSKPAIGDGPGRDPLFILLSPDRASLFWFSSSAVRISGYGHDEVNGRAWP